MAPKLKVKQHHPNKAVAEIHPQNRGYPDGNQDKNAAHGRGSFLDQMTLRSVLTNGLTDLEFSQFTNHRRA